ncbi:hypothetical protein LCGC14_0720560 [marine sediment metagenome]|uniref:Large polyvalent protein associated domain-containing protein n=1 Tax=marine sediment metagenome TaxID=412755 RepID=A0A0F9SXW1_9ZZZZ
MPQIVEIVTQPDGTYTLELVEEEVSFKAPPPITETRIVEEPTKRIAGVHYQAFFAPVDPARHVELDPPSGNFLWTLLTDWLQRFEFAQSQVWRTELEKKDEILAGIDEKKKLILNEHPNMDPRIAGAQAWTEQGSLLELGTWAIGNLVVPPLVAGFIDLILKKDTEAAADVWTGLSGTDKSNFMDLAFEREWGVPKERWGEDVVGLHGYLQLNIVPIVLGLAAGMGSDPINYIPWIKAAKLVGRGGKALAKTAVISGITKKLNDVSFIDFLGRAFKPGYKLPPAFHEYSVWARRAAKYEESQLYNKGIAFSKRIQGNDAEIAKLMTYVRQHPDELGKLSPHNQQVLKEIGEEWIKTGQAAVDHNLITQKAFNKLKETYVWGYYPKYTKILGSKIPGSKFQRLATHSFAQPKFFKTIEDSKDFAKSLSVFDDVDTAAEMRRVAKTFRTVADEPSFLEGAFKYLDNVDEMKTYVKAVQASYTPEEDILKLLVGYEIQVHRAIVADEFIDGTLKQFGKPVSARFFKGKVPTGQSLFMPTGNLRFYPGGKKAQKVVDELVFMAGGEGNILELNDDVAKLVGQLEDLSFKHVGVTKKVPAFLLDTNIAKSLNRTNTLFFGDPDANKYLRWLDRWYGAWKTMATSARLPFHSRNMYSSGMMNYFDGMELHEIIPYYYRSTKLLMGEGGDLVIPARKGVAAHIVSADTVREMAGRLGVIDAGWIGHARKPIWQQLDNMQRTGRVKAAINPLEWGRKLGTAIENQARMAKFIERIEKGDDFKTAANRVFATHYDYSPTGLTRIEQTYFKRAVPFYTWTRKNTPRMAEILATRPNRVANVGKVTRALYNLNPETTEERLFHPEYFDEQLWFKAPDTLVKKLGGETVYMHFDTPLNDLVGVGEVALNLNVKPLQQQALSLFNPLALKGFAEALISTGGVKTFPEVGPIQAFPGKKVPAPWFVVMFPEWLQEKAGVGIYRDTMTGKEIVGMPAKAYHMLVSTIPLAREIERLHPNPIDVERGLTPWRKITFVTGVGFTPVNLAEQKFWKSMDVRGVIDTFLPFFMQEQRPPTRKEKEKILEEVGYSKSQIEAMLKGQK